jgi:hypothetical protein
MNFLLLKIKFLVIIIIKYSNFQFNKNFDNRFIFFKYYKKMREFNHEKQILLMLLNNLLNHFICLIN